MKSTVFPSWLQKNDWATRATPLIMAILNATPDSFSDGGHFLDPGSARDHALAMIEAGADLIDIGAESTRPGAARVFAQEQERRALPIIESIRRVSDVTLSIDTTLASVAAAALDAGANLVNDISAGRDDPDMFRVARDRRVPMVLMHMQGRPETMQLAPHYENVVVEVKDFLRESMQRAVSAGIDPKQLILDPGIGFGKSDSHNLQLLAGLKEFQSLGRPLLIGTSRKGFIGRITGEAAPEDRIMGTAATVAWAILQGASIVRVHDVLPMKRMICMLTAIIGGATPSDV